MNKNENTERRVNIAFVMAMTAMTGLLLYLAAAQMAEIGRNLPPATTAGIVTAIPVMMVSMCGFGAFFAVSMPLAIVAWRERPRRMADDGYRIQQAQYRQLPPAVAADEPTFSAYRGDIAVMAERETATFTNEFAVPLHETEPPPQLGRVTARLGEGDEVTIARAAWLAFAALDTPTREAWRDQLRTMNAAAPNEDYSRCKKIATAYKLLDGAGGWVSRKLRDMVTSWLCGIGEN
jgi:hypothetical protein